MPANLVLLQEGLNSIRSQAYMLFLRLIETTNKTFSGGYHLRKQERLLLLMLVFFSYQWGFFEASALSKAVLFLKFTVPIICIVLVDNKISLLWLKKNTYALYPALFFIVFVWALTVSLMISNTPIVSAFNSLKLLPKLLLFVAFVAVFLEIGSRFSFYRLLSRIVIFVLVQYLLLALLWGDVGQFYIQGVRGEYYGPFGILGNAIADLHLPGGYVFIRLNSFWLEPSNASIFMVTVYFISSYLHKQTKENYWKSLSLICVALIFLTLSLAGLISFFAGLILKAVLEKKKNIVMYLTLFFLIVALIFVRSYLSIHSEQFPIATILFGVSTSSDASLIAQSGSRIEKTFYSFDIISQNPLGIGVKTPGDGGEAYYPQANGNSLLLWTVFGGIPMLLLLLAKDFILLRMSAYNPEGKILVVVFFVNYAHGLINGSLFGPLLIVAAALMISNSYNYRYGYIR